MIPRTIRNMPKLQTKCVCGHTEWDHYLTGTACDGNNCKGCKTFRAATETSDSVPHVHHEAEAALWWKGMGDNDKQE